MQIKPGLPAMWRLHQRKLLLIIVAVMAVTGITVLVDSQNKAYLIETYKRLDKKDFEIQSSGVSNGNLKEIVGQIYCGPQLDKALAYFKELSSKSLCLKLDSVKYNDIKVLQQARSSATLLVDSSYSGSFVTAEKGEMMRKLAVNTLCQVELAKDGNEWKISEVVVLKD